MKHNALSSKLGIGYESRFRNYLKEFLRTNIKMPLFPFKNSILFSNRQYNGESFLLDNKTLYPCNYKIDSLYHENTPLISSQILVMRINEQYVFNERTNKLEKDYVQKKEEKYNKKLDLKSKEAYKKYMKEYQNMNEKYKRTQAEEVEAKLIEFNKIFSFNKAEDLDFPVMVYSNFISSINRAKSTFGIDIGVSKETINKVLDLFFKKIEFSDSDGVALVLDSLVQFNIRDEALWSKLLNRLEEVKFESEFTKVTNHSPFLFRYVEVNNKTKVACNINLAYIWLRNATNQDFPGAKDALSKLEKRVNLEELEKIENQLA